MEDEEEKEVCAMNWIFVFPPHSHIDTLIPSVIVLRDRAFGK